MPGNGHVRFGRRSGETGQAKARHRAQGRRHSACQKLPSAAYEQLLAERGKAAARP